MTGEVERLFTCVVCGRAWASKQSLRAHMKVHKGEYQRTTIYVPTDLWKEFDEKCKDHRTTTCALLKVLIQATLAGVDSGVIDLHRIGSPNPVFIQVQEVFLGKPRSAWKQSLDIDAIARLQRRCPDCGSTGIYEFNPEGTSYLDARCPHCGARWLLAPGDQNP